MSDSKHLRWISEFHQEEALPGETNSKQQVTSANYNSGRGGSSGVYLLRIPYFHSVSRLLPLDNNPVQLLHPNNVFSTVARAWGGAGAWLRAVLSQKWPAFPLTRELWKLCPPASLVLLFEARNSAPGLFVCKSAARFQIGHHLWHQHQWKSSSPFTLCDMTEPQLSSVVAVCKYDSTMVFTSSIWKFLII